MSVTSLAGEIVPPDDTFSPLPSAIMADPYPFFRELRETDPVHWYEPWGAWLLTRYQDVVATHRDTRLTNAGRIPRYLAQVPETMSADLGIVRRTLDVTMAFTDPPIHTRLRALVSKAFTPRVVQEARPRIQAVVDQLLDAVQGSGQLDVIRDFAYPLPAIVVADLLGVPSVDHENFMRWAAGGFAFLGSGRATLATARQAQQGYGALTDYLRVLVERRRHDPRDDLLTALIAAEEQGGRLSQDELIAMCISLLSAGHETTANLIGNGLLALLRNPDQLARLRDEPGLMPSAVEELLRYDSPVQRNWRYATEELEIGDKKIASGELVYQMLGAANRDPDQFPDPDRLDLARQDNRHLAFGYGLHACIGSPLARVEAPIAISTILRRLPRMRLTDTRLEWRPNMAFRGVKSLPVVF